MNLEYNYNFVNPQRFSNVGNNKWLKNETYFTIGMDNKIILL